MSATVRQTGRLPFAGGARRLRRAASWLLAVVVVLLVAFHLGGGWYFASELDARALSAASRRASLIPEYDIRVLELSGDTVRLKKSGEDRLRRSGTFGLAWDGGWGTIGQVVSEEADGSVVRKFHHEVGTPLASDALVSIDSRVYRGDPATGRDVAFEDVMFQGELGEYSAWFVPGDRQTWFLFAHGNSMTRLDGLRILPAVVDAGMPALLPTYRGDDGAPADPSGRLTYGKHEWRDLEAAVRYALDHGAESVVLEGVSMGGSVVVAFLLESPLASRVSGVILDAPVLDFKRAVEFQAEDESLPLLGLPLPRTLVAAAEWLAHVRYGVDWGYTDYLERADELNTPILLIHGADDDLVPVDTSRELARVRPDLVRDLYVAKGAGHVESWNVDPEEYERRVLAFLTDAGALP